GKGRAETARAQELAWSAQEKFHRAALRRGREVLAAIKPGEKALVLIGRNYNTCDPGLNMNLPSKIRDLGVQAIPMDFLPVSDVDLAGREHLYWKSGQKIMAAARVVKDQPGLYPLYLTNFGCGPASFISH